MSPEESLLFIMQIKLLFIHGNMLFQPHSELRTKTKNSCPESGQELSASAEAVSANSFTVFL
jgi:hypothetical protein